MIPRRQFMSGLASVPVVLTAGRGLASSPMQIVVTTGMIADAARQIAGEDAEVRALMGPGVDPHAYRQTRSDIVAMGRADAVLWHGLYLEAQMETFLEELQSRVPVTAVAETLSRDLLLAHEDYEGRFDPHVWMVPSLWKEVVIAVRDALTDLRPEAAERFAANTRAHLSDIDRIGAYADQVLASVPQEQRVLVTAHDAFNYFGAAYDYEVLGIQGISTESEAGLQRIGDLVDLLVDRGVRAVFVESSVSDRNVRALIEGATAQGHEVAIGGELFSDAMGAPGTYEGTYIGMIDHNATVIARALGGTAPERGIDGLLGAGG